MHIHAVIHGPIYAQLTGARRLYEILNGSSPFCRELWYRASLAWREILTSHDSAQSTLLVAHNAVNQALVATAIGLPPTYFRRLLQNNAATTVLDFQPSKDGPPRVNVDRLNQVG